jgi:hypothetical protein
MSYKSIYIDMEKDGTGLKLEARGYDDIGCTVNIEPHTTLHFGSIEDAESWATGVLLTVQALLDAEPEPHGTRVAETVVWQSSEVF